MKKIEAKIIFTFFDDPTPEDIFRLEEFMNTKASTFVYANQNVGVRVHIELSDDEWHKQLEDAIKPFEGDNT